MNIDRTSSGALVSSDTLGNKFQTQRVTHLWTSTDDTNGFAEVPVTFDTPFADTNYTAVWTPDDVNNLPDTKGFFNGDIHSKTPQGFTAVVYSYSPGVGIAVGSPVTVNVIAIHD